MIPRGAKFKINPFGLCSVVEYSEKKKKYLMRLWYSDEVFWASLEEIQNHSLKNR